MPAALSGSEREWITQDRKFGQKGTGSSEGQACRAQPFTLGPATRQYLTVSAAPSANGLAPKAMRPTPRLVSRQEQPSANWANPEARPSEGRTPDGKGSRRRTAATARAPREGSARLWQRARGGESPPRPPSTHQVAPPVRSLRSGRPARHRRGSRHVEHARTGDPANGEIAPWHQGSRTRSPALAAKATTVRPPARWLIPAAGGQSGTAEEAFRPGEERGQGEEDHHESEDRARRTSRPPAPALSRPRYRPRSRHPPAGSADRHRPAPIVHPCRIRRGLHRGLDHSRPCSPA